jgi:transcriptional regulator of acetoin/glycerol metabolism
VPVNVRVIAATHAPLETWVRAGRFRDDLYYRLNGAHITLPPLRERADLSAMMDRLLPGRTLAPEARQRLLQHRWPGNLRELRNVLDYASSMGRHDPIGLDDLPELPGSEVINPVVSIGTAKPLSTGEDAVLLHALRQAQWNVSAVARELKLSRMTLYRRMKRSGIVAPHRQADGLVGDGATL